MTKEEVEKAVQEAIAALDALEGVTTKEATVLVAAALENVLLYASGAGDEIATGAIELAQGLLGSVKTFLAKIG